MFITFVIMDYKKKYMEALERAKKMLASKRSVIVEKQALETIFPELAESEDERMRKWLEEHIEAMPDNSIEFKDVKRIDVLHWLEKQGEKANPYSGISFEYNGHTWGMCARDNGVDILFDCELINHLEKSCEQKFTDKVESKFKVGDWLKYRLAEPFLVEEITEQGYINGNSCLPFERENEIRLWTVQDAKEEDVLVDIYGNIGIYLRHNGLGWRSYCSFGRRVGFQPFIVNHEIEGTHPATPTQRDLLFQKMEEDGYMWDSHAKMLICSTNMESK